MSRHSSSLQQLALMLAALPAMAAAQQYRFAPPLSLPSGGVLPWAVMTADFNEDGYDDFAVMNAAASANAFSGDLPSSEISVFISKGDGTFAGPQTILLPCFAFSFQTAKITTYGHTGLLAACLTANELVFYPGKGDGGFGNPAVTQLSAPVLGFTDIMRFAMGDFNADGNIDIAYIILNALSSNSDTSPSLVGPVQIALGNGDGTFGAPVALQGVIGASLSPGDFNGDGNVDLVVSSPADFTFDALSDSSQLPRAPGNIEILLGNGEGNFTLANTYGVPFSPITATVGDVNGDGVQDIVTTGFGAGPAVLLGNGDGTFSTASAAQTFALGHLPIADLRGNGKPDLILPLQATSFGSGAKPELPVILPGNGNGTFGAAQQLPINQYAISAATGDFDGNGTPDLVFAVSAVDLLDASNSDPTAGAVVVLINLDPRIVNAASYAPGAVASDSIATMFGAELAENPVTMSVEDSAGTSRPAPLFYISPKQINFAIPAGTAPGPATLTLNSASGAVATTAQIAAVAPGIFHLTSDGLVAAVVLRLKGGNANTSDIEKIYQVRDRNVVALPVDLGLANGDQVYLEIFGTGIRNAKTVAATIAGITVPVHFHGASGDVGEDQVNIGPLPASLAGMGPLNLVLTADGIPANTTFLVIK